MFDSLEDQIPQTGDSTSIRKLSAAARLLISTITLILACLICWYFSVRASHIAHREQVVIGEIKSAPSDRNHSVTYTYIFQGNHFSSSDSHFPEMQVGQEVKVYVDSENPGTSSLRSFSTNRDWNFGFLKILLIATFVLASITGIAWTRK